MLKSRRILARISRASLAPFLAGCAGLLLSPPAANAQPPRLEEAREARGRVERMTLAPRGEVDGAVLDDGTFLHWPPHLENRFAAILQAGDQVHAVGRMETGRRGESRFEIEKVTNVRTSTTVENPDFANGPKHRGRGPGFAPPPPHDRHPTQNARDESREETREVRGKVDRVTTAPRGEIDGAVLVDGTRLHWPPHLQDRFANVIQGGDEVRAVGRMETGPAGDTHFEVQAVTNVRANKTVENPDFIGESTEAARRSPPGESIDREPNLRDAEREIDRLQREIDRLQREVERLNRKV